MASRLVDNGGGNTKASRPVAGHRVDLAAGQGPVVPGQVVDSQTLATVVGRGRPLLGLVPLGAEIVTMLVAIGQAVVTTVLGAVLVTVTLEEETVVAAKLRVQDRPILPLRPQTGV